jgi:hypothetical protein
MALVVLWGSDKNTEKRAKELFTRISQVGNPDDFLVSNTYGEPGNIFVRIARVICEDLQMLISHLNSAATNEMVRIESELFDQQYQSLRVEDAWSTAVIARHS